MTTPTPPPGGFAQPQFAPAPPKKSRKVLWIVLGSVGVVTLLCFGGCAAMLGSAADEIAKASETQPPAVSGQAEGKNATEPQAPADGPTVAKFGQTITVKQPGLGSHDEIAYTVSKVKKASPPNEWSTPDHGMFVTVDLAVKVVKGSTFASGGEIALVTKDGTVYEETFAAFDGTFEGADLKSGQRKSGLVVFDVPTDALTGAKIQVKSFWDDEPYGYWTS